MGFGLGDLGSMIGGAVGGIFGGPMGAQLGSMIGSQFGQMLSGLMDQFGMDNVAGGFANSMLQNAANLALQHIGNSGQPQFIQDRMNEFTSNWLNDNLHNIPSDCQHACNNIYVQVTNVQGNNNCVHNDGDMSLDDADMNSCIANNELDEENSGAEGGSQNWLVALARALADIQTKFLDAAMKNLATMEKNADAMDSASEDQGGAGGANNDGGQQGGQANGTDDADPNSSSRGAFMKAQSEFQANFQMFNMTANMTATSLKSLGEGLTSIARKQ
jgi:hypothetical protein